MSDERRFGLAEAHRFFAVEFHNRTRGLLDLAERSLEQDELMVYTAHASCRHWLEVGTGVNHQRGEWLLARVYAVLGRAEMAVEHANRCLSLTNQFAALMEDFDWAFAFEAMARAHALAGNGGEAAQFRQLAEQAGAEIVDEEDRQLFFADY